MTETERHQHTKMTKAKATADNDDRADDDGDDGTRNMKPFIIHCLGKLAFRVKCKYAELDFGNPRGIRAPMALCFKTHTG